MNAAANTKYVCIHGHFYQPPRENAWLEVIELQDSSAPFHDWNERVNFECYAPNAAARILGERDFIRKIANNYASASFNFGPTLLSWLEKADPDTYREILAADRLSMEKFGGHGNAIAQAHSHLIMPLANERDKQTQVRWGAADFERRFGRKPEGMWLPETAADTPTLEALAAQGIRFTILAPRQAKAVRKIGGEAWTPLQDTVDPRRSYLCKLPSGASIALFFYDGNVAQDVAFKGLLKDGRHFAQRILSTLDGDAAEPQLAHIATDGESYGHHHRWGEMALASCLDFIEAEGLATLTNYGEFLEKHPPQFEVKIHENSSWSCVHGVERWRSDCGCSTNSQDGWTQAWRAPLRGALDWLRGELLVLYEKQAGGLVKDIWEARNDYIAVLFDRSKGSTNRFLRRHALRELDEKEKTRLLRLLEMQRHAMLMYTSCAWFFSEVSGIETNQVLQYALRAMYYAGYVSGVELEGEFVRRLEKVPSNVFPNAAASFRKNVEPAQMSLTKVAMHYAASSIFEDYGDAAEFLHYAVRNEVLERVPAGFLRLSLGRTTLVSQLTFSEKSFSFAVVYLGQQNMIGHIAIEMDRVAFDQMQAEVTAAFQASNLAEVFKLMQSWFGEQKFSFHELFKDEKRKILRQLMERSLPPVETVIRDYYEDNYQLVTGMMHSDIPVPETWRSIAAYIVNSDFRSHFKNGKMNVKELRFLAGEFKRWDIRLGDKQGLRLAAGERVFTELKSIATGEQGLEQLRSLADILEVLEQVGVKPELWKSQNFYYHLTQGLRRKEWVYASEAWEKAFSRLGTLLKVSVE